MRVSKAIRIRWREGGVSGNRMSPEVVEWVRLNRDALLSFWNEGDTWLDEKVEAFKKALEKLP